MMCSNEFSSSTVGVPYLGIGSGKVFYELELLSTEGFFWAGFAGSNFQSGAVGDDERAVGGDDMSWGVHAQDGDCFHRLVKAPIRSPSCKTLDLNQMFLCSNQLDYFCSESWLEAGQVFGIAVNLEEGSMHVCASKKRESAGSWLIPFSTGVTPSKEVGSLLFPAISGCSGTLIRYNFGQNLCEYPMLHDPPSPDYKPVAMVANRAFSQVEKTKMLCFWQQICPRIWAQLCPFLRICLFYYLF